MNTEARILEEIWLCVKLLLSAVNQINKMLLLLNFKLKTFECILLNRPITYAHNCLFIFII